MHNGGDFLNWINDISTMKQAVEGLDSVTPVTPPARQVLQKNPLPINGVTPVTRVTPQKRLPPDGSALGSVPQEPLRAENLTAETWTLWREIAGQVASHFQCTPAERAALMRLLADQDEDDLAMLLRFARLHGLPVTARFEFWQLVYPDHYIVKVITPSHTCFMGVPADRPGADLYHGATATLGPTRT